MVYPKSWFLRRFPPYFSHLPIIALTTMASEEHVKRGKHIGINDYQIKLDKEKLMQSVYEHLKNAQM